MYITLVITIGDIVTSLHIIVTRIMTIILLSLVFWTLTSFSGVLVALASSTSLPTAPFLWSSFWLRVRCSNNQFRKSILSISSSTVIFISLRLFISMSTL